MAVKIEASWAELLKDEFEKPYWQKLTEFVKKEYESGKVYPPGPSIFKAMDLCPVDKVKVVIVGQDPYHGANQAIGLSFAVSKQTRIPPSLQNIYKELETDLGFTAPTHGDLTGWAEQGVLLLNATLTVRAGNPGSHQGQGWEEFTDVVISKLNQKKEHLVFILWGKYAQAKGAHIDRTKHLVLTSAHPSPYSAQNFFGNKHFSKANDYLKRFGIDPINWQLE